MPTQRRKLTKSAQDHLRAVSLVRAAQIMSRLGRNAMGTLKNQDGEYIEMTSGQIKSGLGVLGFCLPTLSSVEVTDDRAQNINPRELEARMKSLRQEIIDSLTPEEIESKMKPVHQEPALEEAS